MKRLQNKISESKLTLPITSVYATVIWVLAGLIQESWWIQFGCFALSTFLMVELNNGNALIRIHSRMVSCSFIALTCAACYLFSSLRESIASLFVLAAYVVLFHTYQDKDSPGLTFYGFLCLGLASIAYTHTMLLIPALWVLMLTNLQSLSWRTFLASLIGITLPCWFLLCWGVYQDDFTILVDYLASYGDFQTPFLFSILDSHVLVTFFFVAILTILGTFHYWQTSYQDKFRIRQLYGFFIRMDLFLILLFCLQPQHGTMLLRLMILNTAPLVAHFIALTQNRATNIMSCIIIFFILALTVYNLWM